MDPNPNRWRLARLRRECDVAVGPVLLLAAAGVVLVLVLGLGALFDETTPAQAAKPSGQTAAPAS